MASVLALYNHPQNPSAFDEYYRLTYTPLARKIPGAGTTRGVGFASGRESTVTVQAIRWR
jgi:uncharacterized protein (TIGR02118 family)